MSETIQPNYNRLLTRVIAPTAFALVIGGYLLHSCEQDAQRHANVFEESTALAEDLETNIFSDESVEIVPGVIVTDGAVRMRSTPARVPTNNSAMLSGNELSEEPVAIARPFPVENNLQLEDDDPINWIGGYNDMGEPVFIGINEETESHLTYYTLPDTEAATLCPENIDGTAQADVIVNPELYGGNALAIDAGSQFKRVGVVTIGEEPVSEVIESLESQGYEPTPLC